MHKFRISKVLTTLALAVFAVFCIYPVVWVFISSFKTNAELFVNTWGLPRAFTLENYVNAVVEARIDRAMLNSTIITLSAVFINVAIGAMAAYAVTRMIWKQAKLVKALFILGMMLPTYAAIVPLFSMFNGMRLNNTFFAVIIANVAFGLPMTVFILSGFFSTVPRELEEAAIIDGCGLLRIFFGVITPISVSSLVTVAVISFLNIWNDLLFPQIFLSSRDNMPLPVVLTMFKDDFSTDYVGLIASVVVTLVPTVVVYMVLHARIIDGMTAGAVKG